MTQRPFAFLVRSSKALFLLCIMVLFAIQICSAEDALTNKDLIQLSELGMGEGVILSKIAHSANNFDTSTESLMALKNAGLSGAVVAKVVEAGNSNAASKVVDANDPAQRSTPGMVDMLLKNIDRSGSERIIALPLADGLEFVHVNEILACESDSNYTTLHLREDKRMVISRSMKQFEDLLQDPPFKRIHNRYLVNTRHIRKYLRGDGGEVILTNGMILPVARRKKQDLMDSLEVL